MREAKKTHRTIAIASGKGGVGKTVITANLGLALARQLPKSDAYIVAMDLDLGCGNLNSCLGVRSPNGTINSFLLGKIPTLRPLLTPTAEENLRLISASYSGTPDVHLEPASRQMLLSEIEALKADFVLLDLGAGTSDDVLDLFLGARERIVVITPESLSLHNAFVFLKAAILRHLWREFEKEEFLSPVKSALQGMISGQETLDLPKLIERLKEWDRFAAFVMGGLIDDLKIRVLVNMYRGGVERSYLTKFHHLLFKYLNVRTNISYLGFIHYDRGIPAAVRTIRPFLLKYPRNRAAGEFERIAERLIRNEDLNSQPVLPFPEEPWWLPWR